MEIHRFLSKEEIKAIIGQVAAEHQVLIGKDDPAFFFATICAAVTERALNQASEQLNRASAQLQSSADSIQQAAVARIADETKQAVAHIRRERSGTIRNSLMPAMPFMAIIAVLALILGYVAGNLI